MILRAPCPLFRRVWQLFPGRNVIGIELPKCRARNGVLPRADRVRGLLGKPSTACRFALVRPLAVSL